MDTKEELETLIVIATYLNDLSKWVKILTCLSIIIVILAASLLYVSLNPPAATINLIEH